MAFFRGLDPTTGRWMQVDPKAEAAGFGMSPYCAMGNNPVSNVDPNGDLPFILAGALIGVFANEVNNIATGQKAFTGGGRAALFGAVGAGFGSAVGAAFGPITSFGTEMLRAGAHAATNAFLSAAQGGNFWQGAASGGFGSLVGSTGINPIIGGGLGGGFGSVIAGGDFWRGVGQGVAVGAFNHYLHNVSNGPGDPLPEDFKKNPPNHPDYKAPKGGPIWGKSPNGNAKGWVDKKGRVWVPDNHGGTHAPHWDVQIPGGGYEPVYPVSFAPPSISFREKIAIATGLSGAALTVYIIISEGSRIFPARNLIPIP